ncbi:MAG: hypothetical protein ABIH34_04540 [Nanoarchaeota archaeon]
MSNDLDEAANHGFEVITQPVDFGAARSMLYAARAFEECFGMKIPDYLAKTVPSLNQTGVRNHLEANQKDRHITFHPDVRPSLPYLNVGLELSQEASRWRWKVVATAYFEEVDCTLEGFYSRD